MYSNDDWSAIRADGTIINSGLETVIIRDTKTEYREIPVQEFIDNDESLEGSKGY